MERNGSIAAVSGSGTRIMSDSLMLWKPRIEEPSNPTPSAKVSSVTSLMEFELCCQVPKRSTKRKSTICTPASLAIARTSAGVFAIVVCPSSLHTGCRPTPDDPASCLSHNARGIPRAHQRLAIALARLNHQVPAGMPQRQPRWEPYAVCLSASSCETADIRSVICANCTKIGAPWSSSVHHNRHRERSGAGPAW
ncbi:MAG: hypothetical protein KatS3mg059_1650 [Thermomicrobiales bacterium]|nr:MAG: hypothetical protein KatS3mg059_1650 [Thermomicrobiales bacterium]